jgi:hypothetical protein
LVVRHAVIAALEKLTPCRRSAAIRRGAALQKPDRIFTTALDRSKLSSRRTSTDAES